MTTNMITVAEASRRANRTRQTIHRWIRGGLVKVVYRDPDNVNAPLLLDGDHFDRVLPDLLDEMKLRSMTARSKPRNLRSLRASLKDKE